ncbi:MAG: hypothetical protein DPW09_01940 [Anaerolineae bacterium]|nr:hypothetical protein [Anaerolineae bacterium]MCQ3972189.1 hypothetical protein [Anaerolineae bacterium]
MFAYFKYWLDQFSAWKRSLHHRQVVVPADLFFAIVVLLGLVILRGPITAAINLVVYLTSSLIGLMIRAVLGLVRWVFESYMRRINYLRETMSKKDLILYFLITTIFIVLLVKLDSRKAKDKKLELQKDRGVQAHRTEQSKGANPTPASQESKIEQV